MNIEPMIEESIQHSLESINTTISTEMDLSVSNLVDLFKKLFERIIDAISEFFHRITGWERSSIQSLGSLEKSYKVMMKRSKSLKKNVTDINRPLGLYLGEVETHGAMLSNDANDFLRNRVGVVDTVLNFVTPKGSSISREEGRLTKNDIYDIVKTYRREATSIFSAVESLVNGVTVEITSTAKNIDKAVDIVNRGGSSKEVLQLLQQESNDLDIFNDVLANLNGELLLSTYTVSRVSMGDDTNDLLESNVKISSSYPSSINIRMMDEVSRPIEPVVTIDLEFIHSLIEDYASLLKLKTKAKDLRHIKNNISALSKQSSNIMIMLNDKMKDRDSVYNENVRAASFVMQKLITRLMAMSAILTSVYSAAINTTNLSGKATKTLVASHSDFLEKAAMIVNNDSPLYNYKSTSKEVLVKEALEELTIAEESIYLTISNESIIAVMAIGLLTIVTYLVKSLWKFFNRYLNFVADMLWSSESNFKKRVASAWRMGEEKALTATKYLILKNKDYRHLLKDITINIAYRNNRLPTDTGSAIEEINAYGNSENDNIITMLRSAEFFLKETRETIATLNRFNEKIENLTSVLSSDSRIMIEDTRELKELVNFLNELSLKSDSPNIKNASFIDVKTDYKMMEFEVPQVDHLRPVIVPVLETGRSLFSYSAQVNTVRVNPETWLELELFSSTMYKGFNKRISDLSKSVSKSIKETNKDFKYSDKTVKLLYKSLQKDVKISGANEIAFIYNKFSTMLIERFKSYDIASKLCIDEASARVDILTKVDDALLDTYKESLLKINREIAINK